MDHKREYRTSPASKGRQQQHYIVKAFSSMGLNMALYVTNIFSFCFPNMVEVSDLIITSILRAFVAALSKCFFYVSLGH